MTLPGPITLDTPQFSLHAEGNWKIEENAAPNVIVTASKRTPPRRLTVSGYLLVPGQSPDDRLVAVTDLAQRIDAIEQDVTERRAKVNRIPPTIQGEQITTSSLVLHPAAGRIVFTQLVCDHEKAFNLYWEAFGFTSQPNLANLMKEFRLIADTLRLKV